MDFAKKEDYLLSSAGDYYGERNGLLNLFGLVKLGHTPYDTASELLILKSKF